MRASGVPTPPHSAQRARPRRCAGAALAVTCILVLCASSEVVCALPSALLCAARENRRRLLLRAPPR